jgi:hypothetical protein
MAAAASQVFAIDTLQPALRPELALLRHVRLPVGKDFDPGTVLGLVTGAAASAVKTITVTGTPTGGTWRVYFAGRVSAAIAYNATAAAVQTALEAIFGVGNVTVSGGPGPGTPWVVTFAGQLANVRVAPFAVAHAFTGGTSPAVASVDTTPGTAGTGQADAYSDGAADGTQTARAVLQHRVVANPTGGQDRVFPGSASPQSFPAYFAGIFYLADLVGLDAAGATDFGNRFINATAFNSAGGMIQI